MPKMKVKQLKAILADIPDDLLVVLSRDEKGNEFSPLYECTQDLKYIPGSRPWRRGHIYQPSDPQFNSDSAQPSLVLWPEH